MSEFNNRMKVQRQVLTCVNKGMNTKEELCGLSDAAISRWATQNAISPTHNILVLLHRIGNKISSLASRSQEQITEDYEKLSSEINNLTKQLEKEID